MNFVLISSHLNTTFHLMDSIFGKLYIDKYFWNYYYLKFRGCVRLYETGKRRHGETFSQKREVDDVILKGVSLSRIWLIRMLLFMHTATSRKVVGKKRARDNSERLYRIWSIYCSWHCSCRTYFCCFPLALANIRPWPLVPFFQISLKNSELKTTVWLSRALFPTTFLEIAVFSVFTRVRKQK